MKFAKASAVEAGLSPWSLQKLRLLKQGCHHEVCKSSGCWSRAVTMKFAKARAVEAGLSPWSLQKLWLLKQGCHHEVCKSLGCRSRAVTMKFAKALAVEAGLSPWSLQKLGLLRKGCHHEVCKNSSCWGRGVTMKFAKAACAKMYKMCLRMYLWWSLCTLYLHAWPVRVTEGDSGLCRCTCVMSFERWLTPFVLICQCYALGVEIGMSPWSLQKLPVPSVEKGVSPWSLQKLPVPVVEKWVSPWSLQKLPVPSVEKRVSPWSLQKLPVPGVELLKKGCHRQSERNRTWSGCQGVLSLGLLLASDVGLRTPVAHRVLFFVISLLEILQFTICLVHRLFFCLLFKKKN